MQLGQLHCPTWPRFQVGHGHLQGWSEPLPGGKPCSERKKGEFQTSTPRLNKSATGVKSSIESTVSNSLSLQLTKLWSSYTKTCEFASKLVDQWSKVLAWMKRDLFRLLSFLVSSLLRRRMSRKQTSAVYFLRSITHLHNLTMSNAMQMGDLTWEDMIQCQRFETHCHTVAMATVAVAAKFFAIACCVAAAVTVGTKQVSGVHAERWGSQSFHD